MGREAAARYDALLWWLNDDEEFGNLREALSAT